MEKFNEQAILVGRRRSLVGIITQATATAFTGPAIVILNTGIIHRVGHHRMYVRMSRELAGAGYTSLRFDFSGLGDSAKRTDRLTPLESSLADISEVLDWLESAMNASQIILVGLCSGADHALLYGYADPRVVGLILMDPFMPPTWRYLVHYLRPRLLRASSWLSVVSGRSRILRMMTERIAYAVRPTRDPQYPSLQDTEMRVYLERVYQRSVDRGIQFLAIFTEGPRQTYCDQLLDAFPKVAFGEQLRLEFFPKCDHTFTLGSDRSRLIRIILEWLTTSKFHHTNSITG